VRHAHLCTDLDSPSQYQIDASEGSTERLAFSMKLGFQRGKKGSDRFFEEVSTRAGYTGKEHPTHPLS
jgi:hypothetical protein